MTLLNKVNSAIQDAAHCAARDWFLRQCRNTSERMYLYYKPKTIAFWIGSEPLSEDWLLVNGLHISPAQTEQQTRQYIIDVAGRLPIIPDNFEVSQ